MIYVSGERLHEQLPYGLVVDALAAAFRSTDPAAAPLRSKLATGAGTLLVMPVGSPQGTGIKLLTVAETPVADLPAIQGLFVLFSSDTLSPVAVFDGGALTAIRTAAVSALATRVLAGPHSRRLVVFGAGVQARAHLDAMCSELDLDHVSIVARSPARIEAMVARAREHGVNAVAADAGAVRDADVICTCTTSATPLFDGKDLRPGAHVNAVGSYQLDRRELDGMTMARARVVVEHRPTALAEAGDLALAIAEQHLAASAIAELAEVLDDAPTDRGPEQITVFKSVGVAFEDLAVAQFAFSHLQDAGGVTPSSWT